MSIRIEADNEKSSIFIDGELTIYTAQEYTQSLTDGFIADKTLELDLSAVEEIDTSGIQLIAAMAKELVNNCYEMKIISASDAVKEALDTSQILTNLMHNTQEIAK